MYEVIPSKKFEKSYKKISRSGNLNQNKLREILLCLKSGTMLPERYKDHQLRGDFSAYRECHIGFNLLLMYIINHDKKAVALMDIGTHADLFD